MFSILTERNAWNNSLFRAKFSYTASNFSVICNSEVSCTFYIHFISSFIRYGFLVFFGEVKNIHLQATQGIPAWTNCHEASWGVDLQHVTYSTQRLLFMVRVRPLPPIRLGANYITLSGNKITWASKQLLLMYCNFTICIIS